MADAQNLNAAIRAVRDFALAVVDFAFFAFRRRGQRGVLFKLSAGFVILITVMWGCYAFAFRDTLSSFADLYLQMLRQNAQGGPSPSAHFAFPPNTPIAFLLVFSFGLVQGVAAAAYEAGCLRWMLRGEVSGVMGLRLNSDAGRVFCVFLVWFVLRVAASIVFAAIAFIVTAAIGGPGSPSAEIASTVWLITQYAVTLWIAVRLAPASAVTIGRRRFSFFEAWRVTKGRFWALFGAFFLLYLLVCVVAVFTVGGALWLVYGEGVPRIVEAAQTSDMETMTRVMIAPLKSAGSLAVLALALLANQAISMVFYVLFFGVNARAVLLAAGEGKIDGVAPAPAA